MFDTYYLLYHVFTLGMPYSSILLAGSLASRIDDSPKKKFPPFYSPLLLPLSSLLTKSDQVVLWIANPAVGKVYSADFSES